MRKSTIFTTLLTIMVLISLLVYNSISSASTKPKIMFLGDSITVGGNGGYRRYLTKLLSSNNYDVDIVGNNHSGGFSKNKHQAYPGWSPENLLRGDGRPQHKSQRELSSWLKVYKPDIVLLHIGTNGLNGKNIDYDSRSSHWGKQADSIKQIVETIFAEKSSTKILLAQIIQRRSLPPLYHIKELNKQISTVSSHINNPNLILVNMENILEHKEENYKDEFHPSQKGYSIIAEKWFPKLKEILNSTLLLSI